MATVPTLGSTTATSRKRARSTTQGAPPKRRRNRNMQSQPGTATKSMKENCQKKMQEVSIGLQRLQPLACKENLMGGLRSRKPLGVAQTFGEALVSPLEMVGLQQQLPVMMGPPLPKLSWANSAELWMQMRAKDTVKIAPETELRMRHPGIVPNMRTILLDWMMEVCEEYKLHRETYYLAVDMYDRFLDVQTGIAKEQLQLIGITCLFIAAKIEEIYPPKVTEFAYVTDGACGVANILDVELLICKALNWRLNHHAVSVNSWVNVYMQLGSHHLRPPGVKAREFELPAYSCLEFIRVVQIPQFMQLMDAISAPSLLLDLCTLDISSRQFGSSIMAASAVYLTSERGRTHLQTVTGFELSDIHTCVNWMESYATILSQKPAYQKTFSGVIPQDSHNIQTHDVSISMLENAIELRKSQEALQQTQFTLLQDCSVLMTPPRQERRCLAPINYSTTC